MPKQKPLWHDPAIEWFFVTDRPLPPASYGGLDKRIDRDDSVEIRCCLSAFRKAVQECQKPTRWAKSWLPHDTVGHAVLSRDPAFFHLHDRSFWPTRIGYRESRPEQRSHYFYVDVSCCLQKLGWAAENRFPGGSVVSTELREVLEELQPDCAKFFPVQLEFKDQMVDGYSWFLQPYFLYAPYPQGLPHPTDHIARDYTDNGAVNQKDRVIQVRRNKLAGKHWIEADNSNQFFSGEMARRLEPLILRRERSWLKGLVPVTVIED